MSNHLANETSPYLQQHRDNPVDWYPWGPEAFAAAKLLDRPILLSIGYSACHWCHVMAHESFENPGIAAVMNRLFVSIKVDREERPDIDAIYMAAVQAMNGSGGWPLTVFMTAEGEPFFGGTYFPPEDRRGMAGFPRVLESIADAYATKRGDLLSNSSKVITAIQSQGAPHRSSEPLGRNVLGLAFLGLAGQADEVEGGFGMQPKFPQPMTYEFLLRYWKMAGANQARDTVTLTLTKMAQGGINDQVGGGFHRYSTDAYWLVPHFEKMLYDNAQLATLYLHGWQATQEPLFARVVEGTLGYLLKEMRHPSGGFYSATDADSEGDEGKFFVWLEQEMDAVLGHDLSRVAKAYWGVTRDGNFEGRNILHVARPDAEALAAELGMSVEQMQGGVELARQKLYEERKKRVSPGLDDKVLTAWNALAMRAFAGCGAAMGRPEWVEAARKNADFILRELFVGGRLKRTWKASTPVGHGTEPGRAEGVAKQNAFLEDHACFVDALLTLYEATFEARWLGEAQRIADEMVRLFWSESDGAFFDTPGDHESLIFRPRDIFDNATPSGGSVAVTALLRLAVFTGNSSYEEKAVLSLRTVRDYMPQAAQGFAQWLCALDFHLARRQEVVIMGPQDDPATKALAETARRGYAPNMVLAGAEWPVPLSAKGGMAAPDRAASPQGGVESPLLAGKGLVNGRPAAYVCENYACQTPVTDPDALALQLR
ncbi:MAG: thioredoxin domain-containing protein [Dehalococcoidia bacterium]|nr:thioredoxin domain-containing protein [Dehalococcoidia bacterium]MSQ34869.1 thioredoxin domain-containing protein [Dehalococcoidia bacterium]